LQDLAKDRLKNAIEARIKANKTDIESYVRAKLPTDGIDDKLRMDIVNTISSGVDGMYDTSYRVCSRPDFYLRKYNWIWSSMLSFLQA
jgi:hypothetical protein